MTSAQPLVGLGRPDYHCAIVVRSDSGINVPEDLKGRTVAFGDIGSTSNMLCPMQLLADYGVDPVNDIEKIHTSRNIAHESLKAGDVDAIGTNATSWMEGPRAADDSVPYGIATVEGRMDALPFEDTAFDHVLGWNVIYHGDEGVVRRTIAEIARVLRPGGTALLTMLSKRRLAHERTAVPGREISHNTWVFEGGGSDKSHPHYYCDAAEMLALFAGFEVLWLEDWPHDKPHSWHWHAIFERLG